LRAYNRPAVPRLLALAAILSLSCAHAQPGAPAPIRVLLVDGQNNHDWRRTTESLRLTLAAVGRFTVTISSTPEKGAPAAGWEGWRPAFAAYDVIVSNYNGEAWPAPVQRAFEDFIERGGGAVMVHAANNPFPDWPAFNRMIGLGWRKPEYGDRLTVDDATGAPVRTPKGQGPGAGHGPSHVFAVKVRAPEHPIMRGLPAVWMHGKDQLSHGQRGPAQDLTVLDSAYSDPAHGGTGAHEPMTWVIPFGRGRVVTTLLGHQWRDQPDSDALDCIGFRTVFTRSVEWAATGRVTIPVPANFPSAGAVSLDRRPGAPTQLGATVK
jgi:hypothetical protein